jgi:8-oxo-dGTP pyrophosphatase MutT (NUDIX family)
MSAPTILLNDGNSIPQIGLGTWPLNDATVAPVIVSAIEAGYRHIDTAARYGNERGVGQGIRDSGIRREDLFVTTKLDGPYQGDDRAINGLNESLQRLGLDYVDLLLIQRAIRDDDPWSGHMALPGGRRDPDDADAVATASRETHEEVGVDLRRGAEVIGRLDELRAVARHRPLDLVISPIVFALRRPVTLTLSPREVDSAVWVPVSFFGSAAARATYSRTLDGIASNYPAFRYERYTIWGLTHRILEGFLDVAAKPPGLAGGAQ